MKYSTLFGLIFLLNLNCLNAQELAKLNARLDKMVTASISGNIQELIAATSPRLIKVMGGKEKALELFKEGYKSLANNGVKIDTVYNYHERMISSTEGVQYSFIPQLIVMSIKDPQKMMINYTSTLAIKEKGSNEWTFLDYNQLNEKMTNALLPEFKNVIFPRNASIKPLVIRKDEVKKTLEYLQDVMDKSIKESKAMSKNQ